MGNRPPNENKIANPRGYVRGGMVTGRIEPCISQMLFYPGSCFLNRLSVSIRRPCSNPYLPGHFFEGIVSCILAKKNTTFSIFQSRHFYTNVFPFPASRGPFSFVFAELTGGTQLLAGKYFHSKMLSIVELCRQEVV